MEKVLREKLPGGKFIGVTTARSALMRGIKSKNTKSTEQTLQGALRVARIKGWASHLEGFFGKPDIVFPKHRVIIFVDGCFWHGCGRCGHIPKTRRNFWEKKLSRNRARDRRVSRMLRKDSFVVIRIWEHSLKTPQGIERAIERIKKVLLKQRTRRFEIGGLCSSRK